MNLTFVYDSSTCKKLFLAKRNRLKKEYLSTLNDSVLSTETVNKLDLNGSLEKDSAYEENAAHTERNVT